MLAAVAYFTARWWQPLYLPAVTWAMFTVGGLYEHYEAINEPEGQTVGDVYEAAVQTALVTAVAASTGVALRFAHIWRSRPSGRYRAPPVTGRRAPA